MTGIYNVKSLTLNGNQVTRFADHYNPYNKVKDKTLISQQAMEEVITSNKVPCDYTFSKQHLLNMTYGNITVKESGDNFYDLTYNLQVNVNSTDSTFEYKSNIYGNVSLDNITKTSVYIPSKAKMYDENKTLTFPSSADVSLTVSNDQVTLSGVADYVYLKDGFFCGGTTSCLNLDGSTMNDLISYGKKVKNNILEEISGEDFISGSVANSYVIQNYHYDIVYYSSYPSVSFTFGGNVESYTFTGVKTKSKVRLSITDNNTIKKLYIDDTVNANIYTYAAVSSGKTVVLEDVYYNNCLLLGYNINMSVGNLHVTNTYTNLGLETDVKPNLKCQKLYLDSKFFNNVNLDDLTTSDYGMFGDWSDTSKTIISEIVLDGSQLYTEKTGTDLSTLIKNILKLDSSITLTIV